MGKKEIFGIVFHADGGQDGVVYPKNGTDFQWEELKDIVGGYIEILQLCDGWIMVLNEDGKPMGLPINNKATYIFRNNYATSDFIVGNVLICKSELVK